MYFTKATYNELEYQSPKSLTTTSNCKTEKVISKIEQYKRNKYICKYPPIALNPPHKRQPGTKGPPQGRLNALGTEAITVLQKLAKY